MSLLSNYLTDLIQKKKKSRKKLGTHTIPLPHKPKIQTPTPNLLSPPSCNNTAVCTQCAHLSHQNEREALQKAGLFHMFALSTCGILSNSVLSFDYVVNQSVDKDLVG